MPGSQQDCGPWQLPGSCPKAAAHLHGRLPRLLQQPRPRTNRRRLRRRGGGARLCRCQLLGQRRDCAGSLRLLFRAGGPSRLECRLHLGSTFLQPAALLACRGQLPLQLLCLRGSEASKQAKKKKSSKGEPQHARDTGARHACCVRAGHAWPAPLDAHQAGQAEQAEQAGRGGGPQ
jgi:hypothetical protein